MALLALLPSLYYMACCISGCLMLIAYIVNQRGSIYESTSQDGLDVFRGLRVWSAKCFIISYVFISLAYLIPSLFIDFSLVNASFLLLPLFMWKFIINAWKDRKPINEFIDKLDGGNEWINLVQVYLVIGIFLSSLWATANYFKLL